MDAQEPRSKSGSAVREWAPLLAVVAGFLLFSAGTIDDYGITWDEGVKIYADESYVEIIRRIDPFDPRVLHLPGYFYLFDAGRSLYAKAVHDLLPGSHPVLVHHSLNIVLSTACLWLLYGLVLRITGRRRLATFSVLALLLMPQFVGHSQNNPKDLPAMLVFLATVVAVVAASARARRPLAVLAALLLGVAFTTRILSPLLVPILGSWMLLYRRAWLQRFWRGYALGLAGALVAAVAFWPALWFRGGELIRIAAERLAVLQRLDVDVLYLGTLHRWTDLPWHFTVVQLLITLPLAHIVLLALSPFAARAWRHREPERCDLLWLAFVWLVFLLFADLFSPLHYDGIRHVLPVLPAIAVLVAGAADWLVQRLEALPRQWHTLRWAPAALVLWLFFEIASVHPYQTAYLNPVAVRLGAPRGEEWVELEYWGSPYKAGAEWLNLNAEEDAVVYLPLGGGQRSGEDVARHYLRRPLERRGSLDRFRDRSAPQYLMFITRMSWYDDMIRGVRAEYDPVYTIERQRSTLLEIYSNRATRAEGAQKAARE